MPKKVRTTLIRLSQDLKGQLELVQGEIISGNSEQRWDKYRLKGERWRGVFFKFLMGHEPQAGRVYEFWTLDCKGFNKSEHRSATYKTAYFSHARGGMTDLFIHSIDCERGQKVGWPFGFKVVRTIGLKGEIDGALIVTETQTLPEFAPLYPEVKQREFVCRIDLGEDTGIPDRRTLDITHYLITGAVAYDHRRGMSKFEEFAQVKELVRPRGTEYHIHPLSKGAVEASYALDITGLRLLSSKVSVTRREFDVENLASSI